MTTVTPGGTFAAPPRLLLFSIVPIPCGCKCEDDADRQLAPRPHPRDHLIRPSIGPRRRAVTRYLSGPSRGQYHPNGDTNHASLLTRCAYARLERPRRPTVARPPSLPGG